MSQKVSRKSAVNEDKDKRSTNSPVKDMKKKVAANAEKEKQAAAEKADKAEKAPEKKAEKVTEKAADRSTEKADDKPEKPEKSTEKKSEKKDNADKKNEKPEPQAEKSKEESNKEDKSGKSEKDKPESKKAEPSKQKQNGRDRVHNGVSDVTLGNGTDDVLNGTVSADSEDDDVMLVIDDHDHDELFPELTYDDTSDVECFEPPTPENVPSRSLTRRSQVKATRTPETPRPASDKLTDTACNDPKESKLLKLKDDAPATDRKLRSADSPKPQEKKQDADKDSGKKDKPEKEADKEESEDKDVVEEKDKEESKRDEKLEMEVVVEIEASEGDPGETGDEPQRKTDTNFSKSRVKVSPYRRSMRLADQTNTSVLANYTGNNTTMEMDITESSSFMEDNNLDDSSYLRGLRSIRGRSSYKPLKEITLRHVANKSTRSNTSANLSSPLTEHSRPTGTVVGRKRKPDADDAVELAAEALPGVAPAGAVPLAGGSKRLRVLERLAEPFRRAAAVTLHSTHRRNAEIVGINTDLPLSAPLSGPAPFDPERLKPAPAAPAAPAAPDAHAAVPLPARDGHAPDNKRCVVM